MTYAKLLFIFVAASALLGCESNDDEFKPIISYEFENQFSNDTVYVEAGDTLKFKYSFSDDSELNSLRFLLDLSRVEGAHSCSVFSDWRQFELLDLTGCRGNYVRDIHVPDSLIGLYNLELDVLDGAGNSANTDLVLNVSNSSLPLITSLSATPGISNCEVNMGEENILLIDIAVESEEDIETISTHWISENGLTSNNSFSVVYDHQLNFKINHLLPETAYDSLTFRISANSTSGLSQYADLIVIP